MLQEFEVKLAILRLYVLLLCIFQQKRKDTEVDNLFKTIENITDIKDTEVDRFKQAVDQVLPETNNELQQALTVCSRFSDVENKYKEVEQWLFYARQQQIAKIRSEQSALVCLLI